MPLSEASWTMLNEVMPIGTDAAQLSVEIGLAGAERRHGPRDRRIFGVQWSPVRVSSLTAPRSSRVHALAVVFDFVDPVVAFGCRVDELSELRPYPWRQGGRLDASPARYTARHGG